MAHATEPIPFEELVRDPDAALANLSDQRSSVTFERQGKLFTIRPKRSRAPRAARHFSFDDPLFEMVGVAHVPDGPTDISENNHAYLADAAENLHALKQL